MQRPALCQEDWCNQLTPGVAHASGIMPTHTWWGTRQGNYANSHLVGHTPGELFQLERCVVII